MELEPTGPDTPYYVTQAPTGVIRTDLEVCSRYMVNNFSFQPLSVCVSAFVCFTWSVRECGFELVHRHNADRNCFWSTAVSSSEALVPVPCLKVQIRTWCRSWCIARRLPTTAWKLPFPDMREGKCVDTVGCDKVGTGRRFLKGW